MATANYWGSPIQTGSQHYARLFARDDWRVAYLSDQISPLHLLRWKSRAYTADKFRLWLRGGARAEEGRIYAYNHLTLLPVHNAPVLRSEFVARHTFDGTRPNVFRRLAREGFDRAELLWIDHLLYADMPDHVSADITLYRLADDPRLFPETYPPSLLRRLDRLISRVDVLIVTSRRLEEQVAGLRSGDGVLYVPNGADYDHFAAPAAAPSEYEGIPEPRVVYAGSLEPWFDIDLVAAAARARPAIQFVVIGPARIPMGRLRNLHNVHLLGPRPYEQLPGYLAHAHAGMIPFRVSAEVDAVSPIKLYEYLAAGLPVIATAWDELERMAPPAYLVRDASEFVDAIDHAVSDRGDAEARRAYARRNSWAARYGQITAALDVRA